MFLVGKEQVINWKRWQRWLVVVLPALMVLGAAWWGIRKFDPTRSAIYISDSPDGKCRCAVFAHGSMLGNPGPYEVGLFQGRWPHRELGGSRVVWDHDSVDSFDFHCNWRDNGLDFDCRNGLGEEREKYRGTVVGGRQEWVRQ